MKKSVIAVILAVLVCAGAAYGEVVGRFAVINMSEKDAAYTMKTYLDGETYVGVDVSNISLKFYDSLTAMLLALEKGEIDFITVPRPVGRYILETNAKFDVKGLNWWLRAQSATLNFGFLEKNAELMKKFNAAIADMRNDGTLAVLEKNHVENWDSAKLIPAAFEKFDDAETLTVAVTGDLPPIDYVAPDGVPAGFNVAVLAEIGRRLHMNINTVNVETGARIVALTSGKVDAVFWFRGTIYKKADKTVADRSSDSIIFSEPYYMWAEQYFIGKK